MYDKLRQKLEEIRDFGHAEDEREKDQSELAKEALQILERIEDDQIPGLGELLGI